MSVSAGNAEEGSELIATFFPSRNVKASSPDPLQVDKSS